MKKNIIIITEDQYNNLTNQTNKQTFLGYHSSRRNMADGYYKSSVLSENSYGDIIRYIYMEIFDYDQNLENDDITAMNEKFEEYGFGFTYVSREPIEASSFQADKYKYGDHLYKVYGNGNEILLYDPNEINADIVASREPLYFEKVMVNESINEMAYPSNFNMNQFKQLVSFSARKQYCDDRLQRLGGGSGRIVYKIDEQKALKLAKNNKWIAQNEAEVDIANAGYYSTAEVFDYDDENYTFLEMELTRRCNPGDFKRILGFDVSQLRDYLYDIHKRRYNEPKLLNDDKLKEYMDENEFVIDMMDLVGSYNLHIGDLERLSSYGLVKRNGQDEVVLVDFGGTKDVISNFYSR